MGSISERKPVLVIGGGVAGQRAALDLVHAGLPVVLLEKGASLGGTVAQLGAMFPLHNCLLCRGDARHGPGCTRPTLSAELLDHARPDGLEVWTQSHVVAVAGEAGDFWVTVQRAPRYVDGARCINCDRCAQVCPQELPDPFQANLVSRKAAYKPARRAVPDAYAIDKGDYCLTCRRCVSACPTNAIDLEEAPLTETLAVSAILLATGMQLYDASLSQEYGYGRYANVFTGLEMERMTSPAGPGEGRILRRSDGLPPARIAWFQCVGSRDETHDYCSAFCCGYATRQAVLARQLLPEAPAHIYLMDDRVFGKSFSATYDPLRVSYGIHMDRCRLSVLREDPTTHDLLLQVTGEDGRMVEERFGMVVLSVGAEAAQAPSELARTLGLTPDVFGFIRTPTLSPVDTAREGIFVAGAATGPADIGDSVMQASAAAARVRAFLGHRMRSLSSVPVASIKPSEARRIGMFVCDCAGEIGSVVDLAAVRDGAASLSGVSVAQVVPFGCLPEGLEMIKQTIQAQNLTGVVIGACNQRTYGPLFERQLPVPVQLVSLREECAYVHRDDSPGATRTARELLRMALERARTLALVAPVRIAPARRALVVGGGLAGLTAALHLAEAGLPVHLVEREAHLGGNALRLGQTPEGQDIPAVVEGLIRQVQVHPQITVHAGTQVTSHKGRLGQFTATLRTLGDPVAETHLLVGATVVATGGQEYRGPAYGLGASADVLTLLDLTQRLATEPVREGEAMSKLKHVVLIGCVGPWDEPDSTRTWRCSRTCCEGIVRQARHIKEINPACQVVVLHREINTYAFREEAYTAARRAGVLFIRFAPESKPVVEHSPEGLRVSVHDLTLHETIELHPDRVILAEAILPRADAARTAAYLDIPRMGEGFYREWESKTQPYASLQPGVYLCGLGHGPKPSRETLIQALAAASQVETLLAQTHIVLTGPTVEVDPKRCVGCLTCVRVCPYSVPRVTGHPAQGQGAARGKSFIEPAKCQGCGTCLADCPGKAIQMAPYADEQIAAGGAWGRWLVAS